MSPEISVSLPLSLPPGPIIDGSILEKAKREMGSRLVVLVNNEGILIANASIPYSVFFYSSSKSECSTLCQKQTDRVEMRQRSCREMNTLCFISSCLILLSFSNSVAEAYKNYTVGDKLGWYDTLQKPTVNYQKWVAGKNFSLGDFLLFNTDTNHSVVQTYNFTTYKRCDYDNADTDDTTQWSQSEPSATSPSPITVEVPLLKEGMTYFFSGDYDGEQCKHGQHFKINVAHGLGLPASLQTPSADAPSPSNLDDDSTPNPDTPVSSNFNDPNESSGSSDDDRVKPTSGTTSLRKNLSSVLGIFGIVWIFG